MSNISKIQAALAVATQETTLALLNFNFDCSVFKVEAPVEYKPVGALLSRKRRALAEDGVAHQTARKLGSLFEGILPSTPNLFKAYGTRASEIMEFHKTKEKDLASKVYGPFADYVGVDGTTIWAAATSSPAALAVHLLACLLARAWPPKEAISIWEQIVELRKVELGKFTTHEGEFQYETINLQSLVAARLEISAFNLAEWDASARAWLQAADVAKELNQKQVLLITENLKLPVHPSSDTYRSVLDTWKTCLTMMDNMVKGQGQTIMNGALLVALSSWHIYPDMIVLRRKTAHVVQKDKIVPPGGIVTAGLERRDENDYSGVTWTLSLSHLHYYSDPVHSSTLACNRKQSVAISDVWLFLLGLFMEQFDVAAKDMIRGIGLLAKIHSIIEPIVRKKATFPGMTFKGSWFDRLGRAALQYLGADSERRKDMKKIISTGGRVYQKQNRKFPLLFELFGPSRNSLGEEVNILRRYIAASRFLEGIREHLSIKNILVIGMAYSWNWGLWEGAGSYWNKNQIYCLSRIGLDKQSGIKSRKDVKSGTPSPVT
ncbi:hypothetical protein ABW19_dt0202623 [Dactylella cylindrospora]|nr:hypothetical protein ABW19_dt0202623 [Dactylella cylindrospora]